MRRKLKANSYTPSQKYIVDEYGEHWRKLENGKYEKLGKLEDPAKSIAIANTPEGWHNMDTLADYLGVTKRTILRWLSEGKIEGEKRGKYWFFTQDEAERMRK